MAPDADANRLLAWWDSQAASERMVLALRPPLLLQQTKWPPIEIGGIADDRGPGWQDLQKLLLEMPYRNVDTEQLAVLARDRELSPVDLELPTRARYLVFQPGKKLPLVIREGDLPRTVINIVKRLLKK